MILPASKGRLGYIAEICLPWMVQYGEWGSTDRMECGGVRCKFRDSPSSNHPVHSHVYECGIEEEQCHQYYMESSVPLSITQNGVRISVLTISVDISSRSTKFRAFTQIRTP